MVLDEYPPMVTCSSNLAKCSVNPGISRFALAISVLGESAEERRPLLAFFLKPYS